MKRNVYYGIGLQKHTCGNSLKAQEKTEKISKGFLKYIPLLTDYNLLETHTAFTSHLLPPKIV